MVYRAKKGCIPKIETLEVCHILFVIIINHYGLIEIPFTSIELLIFMISSLLWVWVTDKNSVCDLIVPGYYSNIMQPFPSNSSSLSSLMAIFINVQKEFIVLS